MTHCDAPPATTFTPDYTRGAFSSAGGFTDGDIVTRSDRPGEQFIIAVVTPGAIYRIEEYIPLPEAGYKIKRPNWHTPPPVVIQAYRYTPRPNKRLRPPIRAPDRG